MRVRDLAAVLVPLVLLAGCAQGGGSATTTSPAVSASPSLDKKALIAEGTEAIRALRQTIFDIYADPVPNINDLKRVMAPGQRRTETLDGLRGDLAAGWTANVGTVKVKWAKPVSVKATKMRLFACVDPNGIRVTLNEDDKARVRYRSGSVWSSAALDYTLVKQGVGWLVKDTQGHSDPQRATPC